MARIAAFADAVCYEEEWLPGAPMRAATWPAEVRRCPDRWFTTGRDRVDLLLALGHTDVKAFLRQAAQPGRGPLGDPHV
ncbi:hypothetical protein IMZ11_13050 [Microtetraspora sp. AC03309]|uniref:hypothetical protein n=1 Tax=Microtetraspora sp. AC03309 TaxID=2779376 RepID=UPI001E3FCDA0|nr:hypothetical protein [Microtetraspora sp. AC03309]MCC5576557.1 hypothetical protein [Microtetraspora sp. AC03309]